MWAQQFKHCPPSPLLLQQPPMCGAQLIGSSSFLSLLLLTAHVWAQQSSEALAMKALLLTAHVWAQLIGSSSFLSLLLLTAHVWAQH